MYNHTIMSVAYLPTFLILFVSGICVGSVIGLFFCLLDHTLLGIMIGIWISLLTGVFSGLAGLIYVAVLNTLAPTIGGIPVHIEPAPMTLPPGSKIEQSHSRL